MLSEANNLHGQTFALVVNFKCLSNCNKVKTDAAAESPNKRVEWKRKSLPFIMVFQSLLRNLNIS